MTMFGPASEPGWYHSPKAAPLTTEAIGLHFVSWSWASQWPKWLGHIGLEVDRYLLTPRSTTRVLRLRESLIKAGLRRPCEGDGYKLCDETCQALIGFDPDELRASARAKQLRSEARELIPPDQRIACVECRSTDDLTIDHHVPIARGGGNDPGNLRVLCRSCNSRKGARFNAP